MILFLERQEKGLKSDDVIHQSLHLSIKDEFKFIFLVFKEVSKDLFKEDSKYS